MRSVSAAASSQPQTRAVHGKNKQAAAGSTHGVVLSRGWQTSRQSDAGVSQRQPCLNLSQAADEQSNRQERRQSCGQLQQQHHLSLKLGLRMKKTIRQQQAAHVVSASKVGLYMKRTNSSTRQHRLSLKLGLQMIEASREQRAAVLFSAP
jgi:hypothetical protein